MMSALGHPKLNPEYLNLYHINPNTQAYVVEVSIDDYSEIFNGWDASPLRRKEIEPELMDYLEQAGSEIPIRETIELCFDVRAQRRDPEKELTTKAAIQNNFRVQHLFIKRALRNIYRRFFTYVAVSAVLLTLAYTLPSLLELALMHKIVVEGMFIGGWWILWEGCSLFFFRGNELRLKKRMFERYIKSDIIFRDAGAL